jgi:pimeloyl-ACP methyl ester carboxylesterase
MPGGDYGLTTHVNDMTALLDRLRVERVVLAGHSFGAAISILMAAALQQRVVGVMLFDGGAIPPEGTASVLDAYYSTLQYRFASADLYVERFRQSPLYQPWTDELDTLVRSNLMQQPDGSFIRRVPRYVVDADRRSETADAWQQLPALYSQITCPVLIVRAALGVFGRDDQVLADSVMTAMRDGMPHARVVTINEAGHTSLLTIPSENRDRAVLTFLGLSDVC